MKIYEIYFSPTGGTKKVADILAGGLQGDIVPIDLTDYKAQFQNVALTKEDVAIIAVPSYGGRVPGIAAERILSIRGNEAKAILVCVYGNRAYEDTMVELQDTAHQAGFLTIAAVAAISEHSIARQFAAGRPDRQDQMKLNAFAENIQTKLNAGNDSEPTVQGNRPYKKSAGVGIIPKPSKNCVKCGLCAQKCPVQAIDFNDPKNIDSKACISCMRCVYICPNSSRKGNGIMLAAVNTMLKKVCSERKEPELYI